MNAPMNWQRRALDDCPAVSWMELKLKWCYITLEPRPGYCDRGRWIAKVSVYPQHARDDLYLDGSDGWPRYYFDEGRAKAEIEAWIAFRKIPVEEPAVKP